MSALVRAKHNKLASLSVPYFLTSALTSRWIFVANRDWRVSKISWIFGTNASVAETVTVVKQSTPGVAIADATALITPAAFNTSAADTLTEATLVNTAGVLKLKPGDSLGLRVSNTLTTLAGGIIQIELEAI